jgi:hypothetical protein
MAEVALRPVLILVDEVNLGHLVPNGPQRCEIFAGGWPFESLPRHLSTDRRYKTGATALLQNTGRMPAYVIDFAGKN